MYELLFLSFPLSSLLAAIVCDYSGTRQLNKGLNRGLK
jgi:hypothetical protein